MKLYEIWLKNTFTSILVEAEDEEHALKTFRTQAAYQKGVSKSDYKAKERKSKK